MQTKSTKINGGFHLCFLGCLLYEISSLKICVYVRPSGIENGSTESRPTNGRLVRLHFISARPAAVGGRVCVIGPASAPIRA